MRKKIMKITAAICAVATCLSFAACAGSGGDEVIDGKKVDKAKTQLYVSNFNGGVGRNWLDAHIKRFEEKYAETEFTPGKKGVQVWITNHKDGMVSLGSKMKTAKEDVYFLESVNYYDAISQGYFLDITDLVTTPLTEYGEDVSIEDKLYDSQKSFYKTPNGKYYGLPHAQSPTLLTYNADLFNEKALYLGENGKVGKRANATDLSLGVDGIKGTYDDGLPATYEEFYTLCKAMGQRGVAPMIWSGMYSFYMTRFAAALRADYDGPEAMTSYTFNGTMTHLIDSIDGSGNVTYKAPTEITEQNGYEVYSSASYYNTYKFFEEIYKNKYYETSKSFNEGVSHSDAQSLFLLSKAFGGNTDIGMLVEGLYWVNEAKPTFEEMESGFQGASLKERNLKVMPLPKASADMIGQKTTLVDSLNQLAFISAYVSEEKKELAKTFLRFCSTQQSLEEFLTETGLTRNYKVDYSNVYEQLSPYSKSVVDMLRSCDYIMPQSSAEVFRKNYSALYRDYEMGTTADPDPMIAIKDGKTAIQLFNEVKNKYNATSWQALL